MDGQTTPVERLVARVEDLARHPLTPAVLLLLASSGAMIWANSPAAGLYRELLALEVGVRIGAHTLLKPLRLWINGGLMSVFFFLVGLELKRELLAGELQGLRRALLPIAAAVGGMLVPALLFLGLNPALPDARGWGIPVATDIAFALGMLALVSRRVPTGLRVFLSALAMVDDIGAVVVIAAYYTDTLSLLGLAAGAGFLLTSIGANLLGVRSPAVYFACGLLVWLCFLASGVHATVAAVLMALTIPARSRIDGPRLLRSLEEDMSELERRGLPSGHGLLGKEQHLLIEGMNLTVDRATAPLQRLERALGPLVVLVVLPVFALANAGVSLSELPDGPRAALSHPICVGVALGLFVGKQVGVLAGAWLAVRAGVAVLPARVTWRQVHGAAALAGIGFTMAVFIDGLAFRHPERQAIAKLGILIASALSTLVGLALLWFAGRPAPPPREEADPDAGLREQRRPRRRAPGRPPRSPAAR
ncbi:MAG: Na+/H+ antiporter NhaA [Planctomycetota bacterium]